MLLTKETLYICGDSFCSSDPDYGNNWTEMLAKKLPNTTVVNLSIPGASNYLIYLQVKHALKNQCDYLIYNATGSTRQEFVLNLNDSQTDNINRYHNVLAPGARKELLCMSWVNPFNPKLHNNIFTTACVDKIKNFFMRYVDMPSTIEKNYIFIQQTLSMIDSAKNVKGWAWSQGGFEHKNFKPAQDWNFSKYKEKENCINLWDYYDSSIARPYYHITDKKILQSVCDQYLNMLNLNTI